MRINCYCPDLSNEGFAELDLQELDLSGRTFYTVKLPMISHFPMNPEIKMEKTIREIERKGYQTVAPLFVIVEDSLLAGRLMVEIVKPTGQDKHLHTFQSLKLLGKSFSGPRFLAPKALKEFEQYLVKREIVTSEFFFWYHSCKMCEKEKGQRTVILGRIS